MVKPIGWQKVRVLTSLGNMHQRFQQKWTCARGYVFFRAPPKWLVSSWLPFKTNQKRRLQKNDRPKETFGTRTDYPTRPAPRTWEEGAPAAHAAREGTAHPIDTSTDGSVTWIWRQSAQGPRRIYPLYNQVIMPATNLVDVGRGAKV